MEQAWHILKHALVETAYLLPVLFLVYVLIEVIENKSAKKLGDYKFLNNKFSPIIGSVVGVVPQCGFSVVATDLYAKKHINMGTLLAVYIATSDEAIPIMIGNPSAIPYLLPLLLIKIVYGTLIGYLVNFVYKLITKRTTSAIVETSQENVLNSSEIIKQEVLIEDIKTIEDSKVVTTPFVIEIKETSHDHIGCCGHDIEDDPSTLSKFILHPLVHVIKIAAFIFIVNLIVGTLVEFIGLEKIGDILLKDSVMQPFIIGLVGLIPNCASSVVVTNLFIEGIISFGSLVAGLSVNAGIALTVLFKQNKNIKQNFLILGLLYLSGAILGMIISLIGF